MALQKTKAADQGVNGEYWVVTRCEIDRIKSVARVHVSLFLNRTVRLTAGSLPLEVQFIVLKGSDFPFETENKNWLQLTYAKLKALVPFLADATDVFESGQSG